MLKELYIKNVAVIEEARIDFSSGFNVLTGETGAGKSILIDSINMAMGSRTSKDLIRSGADKAIVNVCFTSNEKVNSYLSEYGIEADDDIILTRQLTSDSKSTSRINGMTVTTNVLKEISKYLIDIHGQSDNYFLLSSRYHIDYLDEYGDLLPLKEQYYSKYKEYKDALKNLASLNENEAEREKRCDMLEFQINEIDSAKLQKDEIEDIKNRLSYLDNIEKIISETGNAYENLYSSDSNAYDILRRAVNSLGSVKDYDEGLNSAYQRLESALIEIEDVSSELGSYIRKTDFNEEEFDFLQGRIDLINGLIRKYGKDEEEILEYRNKIFEEYNDLKFSTEKTEELNILLCSLKKELTSLGEALSEERLLAASKLEKEITRELEDLDMPKVTFKTKFDKKTDSYGEIQFFETGIDDIEFLISPNPGEDLKPLSKIASGGELSRIMLALKSIFADSDTAETLIFDEIDTGVSGRAAQKIAEKLSRLSKKKQVFSITHLAQIASMADSHYLIKKTSLDESTETKVTLLEERERSEELARIIGGAYITDLTLKNAEEMLALAKEVKEKL